MTIIATSAISCNLFRKRIGITRTKMITTSLFIVLTLNSVHSQINGEFWWLDQKLKNFRNVEPSEPVIEVLSEFDNDENAKIVFRDHDDLFKNKLTKPYNHRREKPRLYDHTSNEIVWPTNELDDDSGYNKAIEITEKRKNRIEKTKRDDKFVFNFPKAEKYDTNATVSSNVTIPHDTKKTANDIGGEILLNDNRSSGAMKDEEVQNICSYIKKKECLQSKGVIYREWNQKEPNDQKIICCILPIKPLPKTDDLTSIYFPGTINRKRRYKRSEDKVLNQRNILLLRKFSQQQKFTALPTPKIVTSPEDDYVDPYWNIKNSKFQTQFNNKIVTPSSNYDNNDYGDYASELPRPGLIGLYSDHAKSPSTWSFTSNTGLSYGGEPVSDDDYEQDDVEDDNFGYSTIDPRKGAKKQRVKPVKFTTVSDEVTLDAESHTINFQSNPDFQVLQGFKLLNLFRNRSRIHTKNSRKTTTERIDDGKEFLGAIPEESSEIGDEFFEEDQLFGGCGKAVAIRTKDKDKQLSDAANGSHPWLVLVVLTKRRQNVLCYATLIHPRAAVTVADCVHGTSPRDITVIAGAWDLNDRSRLRNRVADIQVHPKYKPGDDENNLAVLYWMRPLKLEANIQPACLGEPHVGDDCRFFGWGSLDQGIQTRSRWQRASIRMCDSRKKQTKPSEIFCASVSRRIVTGLGGPLICNIDGHNSVVGIAVSMDKGYALMPVREFAMKANELLSGD